MKDIIHIEPDENYEIVDENEGQRQFSRNNLGRYGTECYPPFAKGGVVPGCSNMNFKINVPNAKQLEKDLQALRELLF